MDVEQTLLDRYLTEEDWTFRGKDTKQYTHGLHSYPTRMIPQIAERLLVSFSSQEKVFSI